MTKVLISLANYDFTHSQKILEKSALKNGVARVFSYSFEKDILGTSFYKKNKKILDSPIWSWYWTRKPYIILKTFEALDDDDMIIYSDAWIKVLHNLEPLFSLCEKQWWMLFFHNDYINKQYTKRDCFWLMDADHAEYHHALQTVWWFHVWQKNVRSIELLEEWLKYMEDPRIVTDIPNQLWEPNYIEFVEHRHDQSVLSLLTVKHKITTFRDPSQYGNHHKAIQWREKNEFLTKSYDQPDDKSSYKTLILLHRRRNITIQKLLSKWPYFFRIFCKNKFFSISKKIYR